MAENKNFVVKNGLDVGGGANIDSGTLVVDASSNNVGIGTVSPDAKLDVRLTQGSIKFANLSDTGQSSSDAGIMFDGNGTLKSSVFTEVDGAILSYGINVIQVDSNFDNSRPGGIFRLDTRPTGAFGNANCFVVKRRPASSNTIFNAFVVDLNTGNTVLAPDGGNVGIGTTNPLTKLQVEGTGFQLGTSNTHVIAAAIQDTINYRGIYLGYESDEQRGWVISGGSPSELSLATFSAPNNINQALNINSTGFVGIGTTTPLAQMVVRGGGDPLMRMESSSSTGSPRLDFYSDTSFRGWIGYDYPSSVMRLGNNPSGSYLDVGSGSTGLKYYDATGTRTVFHDAYHPNADTWTTARTLTVGNTGKSVNGSANVAWSLSEIGALPLTGGELSGSLTISQDSTTPKLIVKANANTGEDSIVEIRGARNSTTAAFHSQLLFTNYDHDLTAVNSFGRIAGIVTNSTTNTGALVFYSSADGVNYTESFRVNSNNAITTTGPIIGSLAGNSSTATTLQNIRTIWGQNFNGSANVTGNLTGVGNLTGTSAIAITAGGSNQNITLTPSGSGTVNAPTFNATSTTNGGFQGIEADTASVPSFTWTNDLNTGMYHAAADQIGFATGGTNRVTINSAGLTVNSGRLTTTEINGNASGQQLILFAGESATWSGYTGLTNELVYVVAEGGMQVISSSNNWSGGWATAVTTVIGNSAGESYFPGKIGVGTTTPRSGIHVYGDGQNTANLSDSGSLDSFVRVSHTGTTAGAGGGIIFASLQSDDTQTAGMAAIKGLLFNGSTNTTGHLAFSTRNAVTDTSLTERMRITYDGKIGIGTGAPDTLLHVSGPTTAGTHNVATFGAGSSGGINDEARILLSTNPPNADIRGAWIVAKNTTGATQGHSLTFYTNPQSDVPAPRMSIGAGGNVGVGTVSPSERLHVDGLGEKIVVTPIIYSSNQNSAYLIAGTASYTGATTNWGTFGFQHRIKSDAGGVARVTIDTNSQEVFCVTSPGNVGIGTSAGLEGSLTLADYVTVQRNTDGWLLKHKRTDDSQIVGIQSVGHSGTVGLTFLTNDTERVRITRDGNVGIGTNNPAVKFDVAGSNLIVRLQSTTTSSYMRFDGSGTTYPYIGLLGGIGTFGNTDASPIRFNTNSAERMRITSAGDVGIGTSSPAYKLEVNGSFAATTKSFVIDHPTKPNMKLRYGSLEGPENGVYVRGKLVGSNIIQLPDYWVGLVDPDSITVNLTAFGKPQQLYVVDVIDNKVIVDGSDEIKCFYTVFAERKDVEKLVVEYDEA